MYSDRLKVVKMEVILTQLLLQYQVEGVPALRLVQRNRSAGIFRGVIGKQQWSPLDTHLPSEG